MAGRRRLDGETVPQPDDVSTKISPKAKLEKMRPTQMSVGFGEVAGRRRTGRTTLPRVIGFVSA